MRHSKPHAKRHQYPQNPPHRLRPDRHRPGCEFDYSGAQACKALREEGYEVVLVNSNPATIMTDPEFADRTYIEPITPEVVEKIIEQGEAGRAAADPRRPDGAQHRDGPRSKSGVLERTASSMIGANAEAIDKGEDRQLFKEAMLKIGLDLPQSGRRPHHGGGARRLPRRSARFPLIIRPAFTLGGSGGGIAYNRRSSRRSSHRGLDLSPVTEVLIEEIACSAGRSSRWR